MRNRYAVPLAASCMLFNQCCNMPTLAALCIPGTTSAAFDSPADQRLHFKSDWHRFNVKLRSVGKATVDEAEFERLVSDKDEASTLHSATMIRSTTKASYTDALMHRCLAFLDQTPTLMMKQLQVAEGLLRKHLNSCLKIRVRLCTMCSPSEHVFFCKVVTWQGCAACMQELWQ